MKQFSVQFMVVILTIVSISVMAGEYPVSTIPKALLKEANAVIRRQEQVVEIHSLSRVTISDRYVITILNEKADNLAYWAESYSKLNAINSVDGVLYDAAGNKIRALKKSEIKDEKSNSETNLVDDYRYKYHSFYHKTYPYTIEYKSEVTYFGTMFLPNWVPVSSRNVSVEISSFSLITDNNYVVRMEIKNFNEAPVLSNNGKTKTMNCVLKQQPAFVMEPGSPPLTELAPYIGIGPSDFKLEDYAGSMRTWEEYGKFIFSMNSGLSELSPASKAKVAQLVAGAKSDEEKILRLYQYVQQNTHYISIQLGVGGWKPFPANFVAEKGYGDCKALSNYMVALLKEAGVKANYVLIKAGDGERDIPIDFPASYFNHVICAVPMAKDTIWLECTSQTKQAGYMGGFTGNRHALFITENGGKLVTTPHYGKELNIVTGFIKGSLGVDGLLDLRVRVKYQAECGDDLHMRIHAQSKEEQLKYLKSNTELPNYDIVDFSYLESGSRLPVIEENIHVLAHNYAQITGKRLFIIPNVLDRSTVKLLEDTARLYPIELNTERVEIDTVMIALPTGYKPESIPKSVDFENSFGHYKASVVMQGDQLIYYRTLAINKGRFPAADFNKLAKFYEQVYKADRAKVVLVKPE